MNEPTRRKPRTAIVIVVVVVILLSFSGVHPGAWAGILFPLMFLFFAASAVALVLAPFVVPPLVFYLAKRRGAESKSATVLAAVPVVLFLAWPLKGLLTLSQQCEHAPFERSTTERLGPIDSLLVDGPGMWWLNEKIDVERPEYGRPGFYRRAQAIRESKAKNRAHTIAEAELRSRYKVTIERPPEGSYGQQYLNNASIKIEDRATGSMVARAEELVWGGGIAGNYIAALTVLNPFNVGNRYLSCGYAGNEIGLFRGSSKERSHLYRLADQNLIERIFILAQGN